MDGELESKIKEIGGLLGIEDIPDGVGDIIGAFLGGESNGKGETCGNTVEVSACNEDDSEGGIDPAMLLSMVSKVKDLQEKSKSDSKVKLLKALKPFLGKERRKKVDTCVNLMMVKELAPFLGNKGLS